MSAPDQLHALLKAASVPPEVLTALLNALVAPACEAVVGADRAEDVLRTLLDPVRADALTRAATGCMGRVYIKCGVIRL